MIYGFYFEEPYWNGIPEYDFRKITSAIRADPAGFRIMAMEPPASLNPAVAGLNGPAMTRTYQEFVTDGGVISFGNQWGRMDYDRFVKRYLEQAPAQLKLWIIAETYSNKDRTEHLASDLRNYYDFAAANPRAVGILCYPYSPGMKDMKAAGRDLLIKGSPGFRPEVYKAHMDVGRSITRR
ncbi:MAG: hypothetical protein HY042_03480 [Spirochaetia bacterium]|nr:hypothetical protein [Spirochaetia bacterium]